MGYFAVGKLRTLGPKADMPIVCSGWKADFLCGLLKRRQGRYHRPMAVDVFHEEIADGFIEVLASVTLLSTQEGGRSTSVRGSYRPNHNFFGPDNREMTIGFIELPEGVELSPGQSINVPISFWSWPRLVGEIHPGREWAIQEGQNVVGSGKIIEVFCTST